MGVETCSFPPGVILLTLQMYQQQQTAAGCSVTDSNPNKGTWHTAYPQTLQGKREAQDLK